MCLLCFCSVCWVSGKYLTTNLKTYIQLSDWHILPGLNTCSYLSTLYFIKLYDIDPRNTNLTECCDSTDRAFSQVCMYRYIWQSLTKKNKDLHFIRWLGYTCCFLCTRVVDIWVMWRMQECGITIFIKLAIFCTCGVAPKKKQYKNPVQCKGNSMPNMEKKNKETTMCCGLQDCGTYLFFALTAHILKKLCTYL